jgi:hypothetical protein
MAYRSFVSIMSDLASLEFMWGMRLVPMCSEVPGPLSATTLRSRSRYQLLIIVFGDEFESFVGHRVICYLSRDQKNLSMGDLETYWVSARSPPF